MLKESAVFCLLLAIFAIGFLQALTGLDIADERRDSTHGVCTFVYSAKTPHETPGWESGPFR